MNIGEIKGGKWPKARNVNNPHAIDSVKVFETVPLSSSARSPLLINLLLETHKVARILNSSIKNWGHTNLLYLVNVFEMTILSHLAYKEWNT